MAAQETSVQNKRSYNTHRGETVTPRVKSGTGKRIYNWRNKRNMPLYTLHKKSGVSYTLLFALETEEGKEISNIKTAEKLAKAMDVNPAWLCGWIKTQH